MTGPMRWSLPCGGACSRSNSHESFCLYPTAPVEKYRFTPPRLRDARNLLFKDNDDGLEVLVLRDSTVVLGGEGDPLMAVAVRLDFRPTAP